MFGLFKRDRNKAAVKRVCRDYSLQALTMAGQMVFPIYGAAGGLSAAHVAYLSYVGFAHINLDGGDLGRAASCPGFTVRDGYAVVEWPHSSDPSALLEEAAIALKQDWRRLLYRRVNGARP